VSNTTYNNSALAFGEYGLWLGAFGDVARTANAETVLQLLDGTAESFHIRFDRTRGMGVRSKRDARVESVRDWLQEQLALQERSASAGDPVVMPVSLWTTRQGELSWYMEVISEIVYEDGGREVPEIRLFCGIDMSLARSAESIRTFAQKMARVFMQDDRIWYGFINAAPRRHVPHSSVYSGNLYRDLSWEQLVEKDVWNEHRKHQHERVRGMFWGNMFGSILARRLRDAGFSDCLQYLRDTHPWCPTVIEDESGAMTVFLDDDPVGFAMKRDLGMNADDAAVRGGGMLRAVLGRAGLL
jgi:hypothetical protein